MREVIEPLKSICFVLILWVNKKFLTINYITFCIVVFLLNTIQWFGPIPSRVELIQTNVKFFNFSDTFCEQNPLFFSDIIILTDWMQERHSHQSWITIWFERINPIVLSKTGQLKGEYILIWLNKLGSSRLLRRSWIVQIPSEKVIIFWWHTNKKQIPIVKEI